MRSSIFWRHLLRFGLALGGAADLAAAVVLFAAPGLAQTLLHLPLPEPAFYLRLLALLLAVFGAASLLAANDSRRFEQFIWLAGGERMAAAAILATAASQVGAEGAAAALAILAAIDVTFGLAHLLPAWILRK